LVGIDPTAGFAAGYARSMSRILLALSLLLAVAAPASAMTIRSFHSPSRNIRCMGLKDAGTYSLRCDISVHSWRAPKQPSCKFAGDRGDTLTMGRANRPSWPCVSDAVDMGPVLAYGHTWRFGPFTCTSRTTGVTCRNAGAHGWMLAKTSYRLF
jgi:hypothetical protein